MHPAIGACLKSALEARDPAPILFILMMMAILEVMAINQEATLLDLLELQVCIRGETNPTIKGVMVEAYKRKAKAAEWGRGARWQVPPPPR